MNLNLAGKVVLVTGAARGIGRVTALTFAAEGADVIINDVDLPPAGKVAEEVKKLGVRALAIKADVRKLGDVRQMVAEALAKFGKLDILVNNAGWPYVAGKPAAFKFFHETPEADWPTNIDTTLYGVLNCSKAVIDLMIKQQSGSIINVGSDAGRAPLPGRSLYGAAKGAIITFTKHLANEVGAYGIRVNCVCPGAIKMERNDASLTDKTDTTQLRMIQESEDRTKITPLRRWGRPQEIANAVVFLASDAGSYITGQTLSVDGGRLMI